MEPSEILLNVEKTSGWLKKLAAGFKPVTAIIAGSGLSNCLPRLEDSFSVPYRDIPGFPATTVKGHAGELVFGRMAGKDVVMMRGRFHYYEGRPLNFIAFPIRVLAAMGVKNLVLTAAVGSLKPAIKPGHMVILNDHLNLMGSNPLMGNYHEAFGAMFPDMNGPYDAVLRKEILKLAKGLKIKAVPGVYAAVTGPSYETPAEVRMYRMMGGDVAGMSVVPETIAARQLQLRVAAICWISNFTSGISKATLTHDEVLELGEKVSVKMRALLEGLLKSRAV
ncbi:MAG: purine-nucleoside phosphorylase [Elusimicrobia bacterium RIFOXYA2_FULL_58_8]|nr:MAG: purine-nucleoside phosphorylase [Elusimicrobia bacterium RIFOXYA12_FULL_57_11]OGS16727.1 MAG: purine-nucleoside phosphorylase [Elusimicrobia bacterium RIFOXYA2_FULL_58_8]